MIVVIPRTDPDSNPCQEPDWEWLPRCCPVCRAAVVGHGRRYKQAHGTTTRRIRYRRGVCSQCWLTFSVLPAWSLPYTQYRLEVRQASGEATAGGTPLENAAPALLDADRSPDPSTLRRWLQRRIESLCSGLWLWRPWRSDFCPPTILAWDWKAAALILTPESRSG